MHLQMIAEDGDKDNFYNILQAAMETIPTPDEIIVQGDFNSKVGSKNKGRGRTMGKEGIGYITDNGRRLCDFATKKTL